MLSAAAAILLINLGVLGVWSPRPGAGILLVPAIGMLVAVAIAASNIWRRLAPFRLARLNWRRASGLRGRHRDDIGPDGVSVISPDGTRAFVPWSVIASVRETRQSFVLRDSNGQARVALPKRGLPDAALLPALGTYLRQGASSRPPTSSTTGSPAQG